MLKCRIKTKDNRNNTQNTPRQQFQSKSSPWHKRQTLDEKLNDKANVNFSPIHKEVQKIAALKIILKSAINIYFCHCHLSIDPTRFFWIIRVEFKISFWNCGLFQLLKFDFFGSEFLNGLPKNIYVNFFENFKERQLIISEISCK